MKAKPCLNFSRPPRGFTLVELLVVITIIVVLAAIGIPTMTKMRSNAARTKCIDQFREWGVIIAAYAGENEGKVEWERWESIGHDPEKVSVYLPYMSGGNVDVTTGDDQGTYIKMRTMRHCPAVKEASDPTKSTSVDYAMIRASPFESNIKTNNLAKMANPSRFILMTESNDGSGTLNNGGDFTTNVKPLTQKGPALRHNNATVQALFADFSVRSMTWKDLEKGLSYWTVYQP